jgi:DNA-binding GntR family transcriptional regulator
MLRAAILKGDLRPGAPLPEVQIAADLGVSRAPVREALRMLQEEGLVSKESYRGAFVAHVPPELVEEIRSIRMRIEPFAAERSFVALADSGVTTLEEALRQLEGAAAEADALAAVDAHMDFHRTFYELAGHRLLLETWRNLESGLRRASMDDHLSARTSGDLVEPHRALLECVKRGDIVALQTALDAHITSSTERRPTVSAERR